MKPLSIADYLDRFGSAPGESAPARREGSPFRPRSLPGLENGKLPLKPAFDRAANGGGNSQTAGDDAPRRGAWAPKTVSPQSAARETPPTDEPAGPDALSAKLADAYARGREQGLAEGRLEASERHAAELEAAREEADTRHEALRRSEYAELEGAIRSGLQEIENDVGAAVARILASFLSQEVVKRAVDELGKAIARLGAGSLIRIRGPERVLALLRERIATLPVEVEYVEDEAVETIVEANATQIVAALGPWTQVLAEGVGRV